ncbi:unnamed protein product [Rhizophagus irregularis]|nr:unnamed protein product [Rhizophagus irregularis]
MPDRRAGHKVRRTLPELPTHRALIGALIEVSLIRSCLLTYLKQNKVKIKKPNNPHNSAKEGLPLSGCSPMAIVIQRNGVNNRWKNNKQHYMNPNTP